jgi:hypothetical protein
VARLQLKKPETKFSTGSELLDSVLGIGELDPTSLVSPLNVGGVFRTLARAHQGMLTSKEIVELEKILAPLGINKLSMLSDIGGPRRIMPHIPKFSRFQELMQNFVRKTLGSEFPLFRGIGSEELLALQQGKIGSPLPFSLDYEKAKAFATARSGQPGGVLKGTATPESVMFTAPRRLAPFQEAEIVANPKLFKDLTMTDWFARNQPKGWEPGSIYNFEPVTPDDPINYMLKVLLQEAR